MAENSNGLQTDHNENSLGRRISNGNDLFYVTAESDILNISNDSSNHVHHLSGNENTVFETACAPTADCSLNDNFAHGDMDLSITDKFARMMLASENDVSSGNEPEKASSFSEPNDSLSNDQSKGVQFLPLQDCCNLEETLTVSNHQTLLHSELNSSPSHKDAVKGSTSGGKGDSNNGVFEVIDERDVLEQDTSSTDILKMLDIKNTQSEDVLSECLKGNISSFSGQAVISGIKTSGSDFLGQTFQEVKDVSRDISNSSLNLGDENATQDEDLSFLPGKSAETMSNCMGTPISVKADGLEENPIDVPVSLAENITVKVLDGSNQDLLGESLSFLKLNDSSEISNSDSLSDGTTKMTPCEQNTSEFSENVSHNRSVEAADGCLGTPDSKIFNNSTDKINVGDYPSEVPRDIQGSPISGDIPEKTSEPKDDCLKITDSVMHANLADLNNPVNVEECPFKVPKLPMHNQHSPLSANVPEQKDGCLGIPDSEVTNLAELNNPGNMEDVPFKIPKLLGGIQGLPSGNIPDKTAKLTDACLEIPDSVVFTNFTELDNPGSMEEYPFKVPELPKEEEEFTDAVQFFQDPSSFQFLESIKTSVPPESVIPRSSLYVAFDPLHSKIIPGSQMQSVVTLPRISDPEVANSQLPVNKNLADLSARESVGNILISFDSPMSSVRVQEDGVTVKHYTQEELQQELKIHELKFQEMYLKQHRELEQEMAKVREDGRVTNEKLTCQYRCLMLAMEDLLGVSKSLAEGKKEMERKGEAMEGENEKLKEELKTAWEDLQSVESTFSDFHKRYEQCKGMLKACKDNEVLLREEIANLNSNLSEQEQKYSALQERTQEVLEKANTEVTKAKNSSDGQVTVLRAQLKKAELKISGLESDIKQMKMENSQLGSICDDLMAKVSKS